MPGSVEGVEGRVVFYREEGAWRILLHGPRWVISDLAREVGGDALYVCNHTCGGESPDSILLRVWPERDAVRLKEQAKLGGRDYPEVLVTGR